MSKNNIDEIMKAVKRYENGETSQNAEAKRLGVSRRAFQDWVRKYETFGTEGFEHTGNRNYSSALKASAVQAYLSDGNVVAVDMSQKWKKLRTSTELKEMYIVRYADDFKIFCRDYHTARKTMAAAKQWLSDNLHLQTSDEKSGITNLRKNYTTFLGIKFKVVSKGEKWIICSHMADKSKERSIEKLREIWGDIKNPSKQAKLDANITKYNAIVMGLHNYFCMATMVSEDFAEIAYRATGNRNGVNHNRRCIPLEKKGEFQSTFLFERYILGNEEVTLKEMCQMLDNELHCGTCKLYLPLGFAKIIARQAERKAQHSGKAPLMTTFSVYNLERNNTFDYSKAQTELGYHTRPYAETLHDEAQWLKAEGLV